MITLQQHGKTWELRSARLGDAEAVLVTEEGGDSPMLHRRSCPVVAEPSRWPVLVDAHVPALIREKALTLLWQVQCEAAEGDREIWFCERCLMHEARIY